MSSQMNGQSWYALQVRCRWEKSTAALLENKGYSTLVPSYEVKRTVRGRTREVPSPLFPGYVFCTFDVLKRLPVLVTPGVVSVVSRGRVPSPLETHEVTAIEALVHSGVAAEPWPYLEMGQRVRIESDALMGVEGILTGFKGSERIIVSITLLQRSVALEIHRARVSPVERRPETSLRHVPAGPLLERAIA